MTVLPVVERELRVASRRRATYWTRFGAASIAIAISAFIFLTGRDDPPREIAQVLFASASGLAFAVCLLAGVPSIADCVSEEKREGTLGLLFLTDLKGYDVVFGKLAAGSLNWIYATFAVFPVLALPLLLGGVAPEAFWRMVLLLVNTLFVSLSLGMAISTFSHESRRAIAVTLVSVLFLTGGLPLLGFILAAYAGPGGFPDPHLAFLLPSPAFTFVQVMKSAFSTASTGYYTWSMLTLHGLGWLALGSACFALPRCWQDRPATPRAATWREGWKRVKYGTAEEGKALRNRLLEINPVLWVGGRDRIKGSLVWAFLVVVAGFWLWGYLENQRNWLEPIVGIWTAGFTHGVLKIWLASEACRQMIEHRRGGALELLLSTPLSTAEIIRGQRLALRRQFGAPVVTVLVADVFLLLGSQSGRFAESGVEKEIIATYFAGMVMLAMDYYVLGWVGLWRGLSARNFSRAVGDVIGRILILPWGMFCLTMIVYVTLDWRHSLELDFQWGVAWWCFLCVGLNLMFLWSAQRCLNQRFRLVATQQYAPARRHR